jgi:predicted O-methyltransferase YrrM
MTHAAKRNFGGVFRCMSAASFWTPIWVPPESSWLEHAPFGFWLIDALRPHSIVELGTYSGYSFAVFCQAVQTLNLDCRCYGVEHREGDARTGSYGEEIFRAINDHIETHYKSFSSLIRSNFDQARAHFADGSIDLLHIDGCHSYKAALEDFMSWRSRLSKSGVVLFHHTNVCQQGFGVARLWQELARDHKHFEFVHGLGLGVLGAGETFPAPLEYLFGSTRQPQVASQIRLAYSQLSSIISLRVQCGDPAQFRQRDLEHAKTSARLAEMELELRRQSTRQAYLTALASMREAEVTNRDQIIEHLQKERDSVAAEIDNRVQEIEHLQAERDSIAAIASSRKAEIEHLQKERDSVAAEIHNRVQEIEHLQAERDSIAAIASSREAEIERLQAERQRLLNSTSWRITAPLRSVIRVLRHGKNLDRKKQ